MATLSEDRDSWRAAGLMRRDFRHDFGVPDEPQRVMRWKKKNTRRWCKGKVGRPHLFRRNSTFGLPFDWLHIPFGEARVGVHYTTVWQEGITTTCVKCSKEFHFWRRR